MAETPSLPDIIEACIDRRLEGVHTATPGTIRSYSASDQTATVRPSNGAADHEQVPVIIPGAWVSGDPVLLVYCETEVDANLAQADESRRHGVGAPLAIPLIARSSSGVDFVALAGLVISRLEAMQSQIDSHVHMYSPGPSAPAPSGPAISAPPAVPISWPTSSVAATKMKAK